MQRIQISIVKDAIFFTTKNTPNTFAADLSNTSIIETQDLVFTPQYIEGNQKEVSLFIQ